MNEQQWRRAWDIYQAARELPDAEQRPYVRSLGADAEVVAEVEAMLDDPAGLGEPSLVGRTFGRYEIVSVLGGGGMGQVYAGRDTELDRMVAVKFLSPEMAASRAAVERLIREAKSASALNHPHIVTVYEVIHSGPNVAIAMELVEGRSLRLLCGRPQDAAKVMEWGRQIAQALAAAHQRGIVHRDIKPENLMVRDDGIVKVLDFGLARQTAVDMGRPATNSLGLLAGSLNYMSPEQTRGESAGGAADVFSLGIVLYELATGSHPFRCASPIDTAHAIAHAEPKEPSALHPAIPPGLNRLLLEMLDKVAANRPPAIEVDRRLAELSAAPARRPSRARLAVGLMAMAAVAVVAVAILRDRDRPPKQPAFEQLTAQVSENRVTAAAISPDGQNLAFAAFRGSVFIRRMSDGGIRSLPTPDGLQVDRIAWFADGQKLLVSGSLGASGGSTGDHPAVWAMATAGAPPEQILSDGKDAVPSPDGTRMAFVSADRSTLWLAGADGGSPRQVRRGAASTSFSAVIWSPDGKRLAYQRREELGGVGPTAESLQYAENRYRYQYESVDVGTRQVVASLDDVIMISACGTDDGSVFYVRWPSRQLLNVQQLWVLRTDPRTGAIRGPARRLSSETSSGWESLSASRDGKQVVVVRAADNKANVYLAGLSPADEHPVLHDVRRLTFSGAEEFPHAWTLDSRQVIFESSRGGDHYDLYRQAIDRREAEPVVVSPETKVMAHVTADGLWLLFRELRKGDDWNVRRVPLDGGAPETLLPHLDVKSEFRCGLRTGARCVMRAVENDQFVFRELDPLHGVGRELARTAFSPLLMGDWDLSPDGSQVAIPNHDVGDAKIRVITLDAARTGGAEQIVTPAGMKNLSSVVWAADGRGWYVSMHAAPGGLLMYVDLEGRSLNLLSSRSPTYAVPSPDGRYIAFPDWNVTSNAWLLRGME